MSLTVSELSFLRLLERTKKLAREDLAANVWKVNAAVLYLENLFSRLQDEKTLHNSDTLMQYGRELNQMKLLVEAENCKSAEEKLTQLDLIPRRFPDTGIEMRTGQSMKSSPYRPIETASEVRVRNRAVYRADLRKQLLGEEKERRQAAASSDDLMKQEEKQENIANELLSLTRSLKQNMTVAGNVLKDDNKALKFIVGQVLRAMKAQVLSLCRSDEAALFGDIEKDVMMATRVERLASMHTQVDTNTSRLKAEGVRLAHHAYKCGFDCALVFVALFIFWSFICMVVVMKIFPKKLAS